MLALEPLAGLRAVAAPDALDTAHWDGAGPVLRLAPDDAFAIGAASVAVDDEHAIVTEETGFMGAWLSPDELKARVMPHIEWPLPDARPALAQGLIAGVPAKLWLTAQRVLLVCAGSHAHELGERLS